MNDTIKLPATISRRDWFAASAMESMIQDENCRDSIQQIAVAAFKYADALLSASNNCPAAFHTNCIKQTDWEKLRAELASLRVELEQAKADRNRAGVDARRQLMQQINKPPQDAQVCECGHLESSHFNARSCGEANCHCGNLTPQATSAGGLWRLEKIISPDNYIKIWKFKKVGYFVSDSGNGGGEGETVSLALDAYEQAQK